MKIISPTESILGKSFSDWTVSYWQWILPIPTDKNPYYDRTGEYSNINQNKGVYFFTNAPENSRVYRKCNVPLGKIILVPLNTSIFTTLEHGYDFSHLQEMADTQEGDVDRIKIIRDNFDLSYKLQRDPDWWKSYRVKSPIFDFTIPKIIY